MSDGLTVVRGRRLVELDGADVRALLDGRWAGVAVDVGTGDGRLALQLARSRPDWLVVGMDANASGMEASSSRALRKPARGGVANVVYVAASVESWPTVLWGRASEVSVVLPWGRLMSGLLLGSPDIVGGVARLGRPGASVRIVLNGEVWGDPVPVEAQDLPEPTVGLVRDELAPTWRAAGLVVDEAWWLSPEEIAGIPSTWARRLSHGRAHPRFLAVRATVA